MIAPKLVLGTGIRLLAFIVLVTTAVVAFRQGGAFGVGFGVLATLGAVSDAIVLIVLGVVVWKGDDWAQPDEDDRLDAAQAAALANVPNDELMIAVSSEIPGTVRTDGHGYRFTQAGVNEWAGRRAK